MIAEAIDKIVASNGQIYEVRWDSTTGEVLVVDRGPAWLPTEDGATSHVGYASSEPEAMEKAKAATYEMLSSFDKYVSGTTLGKSEVIAVHLLLGARAPESSFQEIPRIFLSSPGLQRVRRGDSEAVFR